MTDGDPVSWLLVRRGWRVVTSDGTYAGDVDEVAGDESADIFDGLSVRTRALVTPRYVAAELVASIVEGEVHVSLSEPELEAQPEYAQPPPSVEIAPADVAGGEGWWRRLARRLGGRG